MTAITRRHAIVTLYDGDHHAKLSTLIEEAMSAYGDEATGVSPQRFGTKSVANAKAIEYDAAVKEAEETATKVAVWALRYDHMTDLQDEHPPRTGEVADESYGVNMKTFPRALAEISLIDPVTTDQVTDLAELQSMGRAAMLELGVSKAQYLKLESAAWNVNNLGDEIPKESLASLLTEAREQHSKPQPDSESAPKSSTGSPRPKRTSTSTRKATSPVEPSSPAPQGGTTEPDPAL